MRNAPRQAASGRAGGRDNAPPPGGGGVWGERIEKDHDAPSLGKRELKILAPHLRPYLGRTVWAIVLVLISQLSYLASPFLLRYGIDEGIKFRNPSAIDFAAVALLLASIVHWWTLRRSIIVAGEVGEKGLKTIRMKVFDHLTSLDIGFFEREKAGRLVSRLTSDVETIEILVTESLVQMAGTAVLLVGSIAVLFALDVTLAFITLLAVGPPLVVATMRFRTRSEQAYGRVRERVASVLSMMQETVRGVQVIQAFGRERFNASRFRDENGEWKEANVESFRLGSLFFPAMELVGLFGSVVVLGYGGWRALQGDISIGVLSAFVLYLTATLEPVQQLSQLYDVFQSAMAGLAKIAQLLDEKPKIVDSPESVLVPSSNGQADVDEVNFRYGEDLPYALQDIDLEIAAGEMIALVGPTGAGKSTIAKLLLRFYDPSDGTVKLDGRNLKEVKLESLRQHASVVPQEGFLFRGTVRDNVRFGRPDATDEEVEEICRVLGIDEVIRAMPGGYEAEVRERGSALSSGERQMIALARALLADPRILILDEATSALDGTTEARIESALKRTTQGRTTVVIAHRLLTARRADRVAVVDHGRLVEVGTHDELSERPDGVYARLYQHWLSAGQTQN